MSRLEALKEQHSELDKQIQVLEKNYGDQDNITYLKRKKLKLKDEIYLRRKKR